MEVRRILKTANLRFLPSVAVFLIGAALQIGGYVNPRLSHWLFVVALFLLFVAVLPWVRRIRVSLVPEHPLLVAPPEETETQVIRTLAVADELAASYISDRQFRIADLVREDFVVVNRTMERCTIYGPAVVLLNGGKFVHNSLEGSPESVLITTPNSRLVGVIELRNCTLIDCKLKRIGLIGNTEHIERLRAGFGIAAVSSSEEGPAGTAQTQ